MKWLIGLPMLLVGLGMLGWVPYAIVINNDSNSWPIAEGQVTKASVTTRSLKGTQSQGNNGLLATFYPSVQYAYEVRGHQYTGSTISFASEEGPASDNQDATHAYVQSFVQQKPLKVYYDPKDPSRSCLQPGGALNWTVLIASLFFGALSFLFGMIALRSGNGDSDEKWRAKLAEAQALQDARRRTNQ